MAEVKIIITAIKAKLALNAIKKAKINTWRMSIGLRPRYTFYKEFFKWLKSGTAALFLRAFCCCCRKRIKLKFEKEKKKKDDDDEEKEEKYWYFECSCKDTFSNRIMKSFLGFLAGLFITLAGFMFSVYMLNFPFEETTLACIGVGIFLGLTLAFSNFVRCIVMLLLPYLVTEKGRWCLLGYVIYLVTSGPAHNIVRNSHIMSESMTCTQEEVSKTLQETMQAIFAPFLKVKRFIKRVVKWIRTVIMGIRKFFRKIKRLLRKLTFHIDLSINWLRIKIDICNKILGTPFRRCHNTFQVAIDDCRVKLKSFKFLCEIVKLVQAICKLVKLKGSLCTGGPFKEGLKGIVKHFFRKYINSIDNMIFMNVTMNHTFHFEMTQTKDFNSIRTAIQEEIRERTAFLTQLLGLRDVIASVLFVLIVFQAFMYRKKFLSKDAFDNRYLSIWIHRIDERRRLMGKQQIFPLKKTMRRRYVRPYSLRLVRREKFHLTRQLFILIIKTIQLLPIVLVDYGMYRLLLFIHEYGNIKAGVDSPSGVYLHVEGKGPIADMYRWIVENIIPRKQWTPQIDMTKCLPVPSEPDWVRYRQIGILLFLCFFLTLIEAYTLRLRHMIVGMYHPDRKRQRAIWLYNHILMGQAGLMKARKKGYSGNMPDLVPEKISFLEKMSHKCECCRKLLKAFGYERKYCIMCAQSTDVHDYDTFYLCESPGCVALYCGPCFRELANKCSLCSKAIDYSSFKGFSDEKDSSEEEDIKRSRKNRREKMRKQKNKSMTAHGMLLIKTPSKIQTEEGSNVYTRQHEPGAMQRTKSRQNLSEWPETGIKEDQLSGDTSADTRDDADCVRVRIARTSGDTSASTSDDADHVRVRIARTDTDSSTGDSRQELLTKKRQGEESDLNYDYQLDPHYVSPLPNEILCKTFEAQQKKNDLVPEDLLKGEGDEYKKVDVWGLEMANVAMNIRRQMSKKQPETVQKRWQAAAKASVKISENSEEVKTVQKLMKKTKCYSTALIAFLSQQQPGGQQQRIISVDEEELLDFMEQSGDVTNLLQPRYMRSPIRDSETDGPQQFIGPYNIQKLTADRYAFLQKRWSLHREDIEVGTLTDARFAFLDQNDDDSTVRIKRNTPPVSPRSKKQADSVYVNIT